MKVEIITIGDEILIGQIVDTNSNWIATNLTKLGFEIKAITSVGDYAIDITNAIDTAFSRSDIVLLTGGIGPTKDDITKNTLCDYFNTHLIFDESVLNNIERIFSHRKQSLNELTKNQAFVPKNSTVIQNTVGTAPLLWIEKNNKILISMPGVPFEMKNAMTNEIMPRLTNLFNLDNYQDTTLLVSGITESALAMSLDSFENNLPENSSLAYLPSYGMIRLRLSMRNSINGDSLAKLTNKLKVLVKDNLIDDIDRPIEELLGILLQEKGLTLSTAESCTGGNISSRIVSISGSSQYFMGSIVSYSNVVKKNILNVSPDTLNTYGAVSSQVSEEMANGVANVMSTDCAIAVTGIAGPTGGTDDKPVGTTWISTKYNNKIVTTKYQFGVHRDENINRASNMGMLQLIRMIRE